MAPASATHNPDKLKKQSSRASSTSKPEVESPIAEQAESGSESTYLKELQKLVMRSQRECYWS